MNINNANMKCENLIINQNKKGNRIDFCYSDDGNCRECRYNKECEWFKNVNNFIK